MVYVWMEISLTIIITKLAHFHAYVVIVVGLLRYFRNVCCLTYTFYYELFFMKLYESC